MTYKSHNPNDMTNLFDNGDIQNIHKVAKKVAKAFPDITDEFEEEIDDFVVAVKTVKRAFEILSEDELERIGVELEVIEDLVEKMDLIEEDIVEEPHEDFADIEEVRGYDRFEDE